MPVHFQDRRRALGIGFNTHANWSFARFTFSSHLLCNISVVSKSVSTSTTGAQLPPSARTCSGLGRRQSHRWTSHFEPWPAGTANVAGAALIRQCRRPVAARLWGHLAPCRVHPSGICPPGPGLHAATPTSWSPNCTSHRPSRVWHWIPRPQWPSPSTDGTPTKRWLLLGIFPETRIADPELWGPFWLQPPHNHPSFQSRESKMNCFFAEFWSLEGGVGLAKTPSSSKIDPSQIPSPTSHMVNDGRTVFNTVKHSVPPSACTYFTVVDEGSCSPQVMRPALHSAPADSERTFERDGRDLVPIAYCTPSSLPRRRRSVFLAVLNYGLDTV